jgi:hypothetical protein
MFDSIQQSCPGFDTLDDVHDIRLTWLLFGSYAGIVIVLLGGIVTMPELFFGFPHRGISFWGNYFPAVIPYTVGLLTSVVCLCLAAYIIPDYADRLSMMRRLLVAIALGLMLILLTPDQMNQVFYWGHTFAAIYLFVVAGVGSIWVMLHDGRTHADWLLFWLLTLGSVLSLFSASYVRLLGVLALGQVLALNAGALIIIRAALRWSTQEVKE